MHTALYAWAAATLDPSLTTRDKRFAEQYCRQLGMPKEVTEQKKGYWAGSLGTRANEDVLAHMSAAVDQSDYRWVKAFAFPVTARADLLFRQYGLVKWLPVHYKERLDASEIEELAQKAQEVSAAEIQRYRAARRKELAYRYCPHGLIRAARRIRNRIRPR
jgi:hypothetical protein